MATDNPWGTAEDPVLMSMLAWDHVSPTILNKFRHVHARGRAAWRCVLNDFGPRCEQ